MIVLHITYHCKPGMRERFLQSDCSGRTGSRLACGRRKSPVFLLSSVDSNDDLLLIEKWRDADAVAIHSRQPHFTRIGELKAMCVLETVAEKLTVQA